LQGYWDGYDHDVNPNVIDAFSAAAFRFGHTLLPTSIERWSKAHKFIGEFISKFVQTFEL
jgi:peroxidase